MCQWAYRGSDSDIGGVSSYLSDMSDSRVEVEVFEKAERKYEKLRRISKTRPWGTSATSPNRGALGSPSISPTGSQMLLTAPFPNR
jgi:hypothetical protein